MHKFSEIVFWRTGERVPKFYVFVVRVFCPVFAFLMLHLNYTGEFDSASVAKRVAASNYGYLWGGRLLWLVPLLILLWSIFFPLKGVKNIHDLILE